MKIWDMRRSKLTLLSSAFCLAIVQAGAAQTQVVDLTSTNDNSKGGVSQSGLPEVNLPSMLGTPTEPSSISETSLDRASDDQGSSALPAEEASETAVLDEASTLDQEIDAPAVSTNSAVATDILSNGEGGNLNTEGGAFDPDAPIIATDTQPVAAQETPAAAPAVDDEFEQIVPLANSSNLVGLNSQIEGFVNAPIEGLTNEEQEAIKSFYVARAYSPFFVQDENANKALNIAISNVSSEGLPASRYRFSGEDLDLAHAEVFAAAKFIRYGRDMERGMIDPRSLSSEFDFTPQGRGYDELLTQFSSASDKAAFMKDLQPKDPAYGAMKAELASIYSVLGQDIAEPILVPEGATLKLGERDPRVATLRARLEQLGYPSSSSIDPQAFDEPLESAVMAFQSKASLSSDGVVGPATINVLNSGPSDHLRKVLVGMERLRWGPQNVSGRQIFVNLANFTAQVRDDNIKTFETIVVVGKNDPKYRTPEFNDTMTHLIVNPKWNVPESISVREYLPKIQRDPGILSRQNIVMRIKGSGQEVSPHQIDMSQFTVDDFPFLLQQQSGDGNALGNVKFMFPNSHNIYLHDTPSKSLFSRSVRTFSHGCVRVRDPEDLATTLLAPQFSDPRGTYRDYVATGSEKQVNFDTPIPIHLTYFTAYLNELGTISYTGDAYGRDGIVADALKAKGLDI